MHLAECQKKQTTQIPPRKVLGPKSSRPLVSSNTDQNGACSTSLYPIAKNQLNLKRVSCLISCCTTLWKPQRSLRENQATGTDSNFGALVPPLANARPKECEECGWFSACSPQPKHISIYRARNCTYKEKACCWPLPGHQTLRPQEPEQ